MSESLVPFFLRGGLLLTLCLALCAGSARAEKKKIIFDTDIAGDIDDAFAHALVQLSGDRFEVLGITTCDGPTAERARVSCRMLWEAGQENIPVAVGRPTRQGDQLPAQLAWGEGFDKYRPVQESAAEFIVRTLKKYPHQVTIISVGPTTNLGDAIKLDPAAWKLVKEVVAMFGSFYMGYGGSPIPSPEWNVVADVPSAQAFMTSGVPIRLAGLDVTTLVNFDEARRGQIAARGSALTDAIMGLYSLWSSRHAGRDPVLFDPVAVSMALGENFVQTRRAHVRVTDEGYTVVDESQPSNCEIGMSIDKQGFLDWLTGKLLTQNLMR
ncbi:nucleoside hydrolase [bacterium]|nr:nucleoside hydrolase [bacterium]